MCGNWASTGDAVDGGSHREQQRRGTGVLWRGEGFGDQLW